MQVLFALNLIGVALFAWHYFAGPRKGERALLWPLLTCAVVVGAVPLRGRLFPEQFGSSTLGFIVFGLIGLPLVAAWGYFVVRELLRAFPGGRL